MDTLKNLPASLPGLYDPSYSLKLVGVAGKYDRPEGPLSRIPAHTVPGGSNEYHRTKIEGSWTAGYFPASLWLMVERLRLLPAALALPPSLSFFASPPTSPTGTSGTHSYLSMSPSALFSLSHFKPGSSSLPHPEPAFDSKAQKALEEELISIAKRYSADLAPCADKDEGFNKQGFKFGTCFAKQYELLDEDEAKDVLVSAAKALAKGWDEKIGAIRSVDAANLGEHRKSFTADQKASHFLVTIDSLANLSILFDSSDEAHRKIAEKHADTVFKTFIRDDGKGVWELVNFAGAKPEKLHIHGSKDGSGWSRGLAWAIYGFAHAALHTGRKEYSDVAARLAETLNASLPADGVPYWDAHVKTHRDATAATIAASGLLALYKTTKDEVTLSRAFKLIKDTLAHCKTGRASGRSGGIDMGKEGWETLLRGSTEDGKKLVDIGTVYADYYFLEFGNEALKLQKQICS